MCLIIARPAGSNAIPLEYIENASENNPDGFGIVGKDKDGNVRLDKSLVMDEAVEFIRHYEKDDMEFAAHFRYKTHGKVDLENTHPFKFGDGNNYVMHNGIIDIPTPEEDRSDTWHFVNTLTKAGVKPKAENLTRFLNKRSKMLGTSKFAFIGEDTPLLIYNQSAGVFKGGVWYSNEYSLDAPKWVYPSSSYETGSSWGGAWRGRDWSGDWLHEYEDALFEGTLTMADLRALSDDDLQWMLESYSEELVGLIKYGTSYTVGLKNKGKSHSWEPKTTTTGS